MVFPIQLLVHHVLYPLSYDEETRNRGPQAPLYHDSLLCQAALRLMADRAWRQKFFHNTGGNIIILRNTAFRVAVIFRITVKWILGLSSTPHCCNSVHHPLHL